jgi:hypothetical protein
MTGLEQVIKRAAADLDAVGAKWAIIGGLAVATRAAPRFTQDVDFAVSVADDAEAEDIVHRMSVRGYAVGMMLEQDYVHRLATIRLIRPVPGKSQVFVDLLFGSSGIRSVRLGGGSGRGQPLRPGAYRLSRAGELPDRAWRGTPSDPGEDRQEGPLHPGVTVS